VEDGVTGLLYTPEGHAKFLACVAGLAQDLERAKRMGQAGQKKARLYAWETTLDQLVAFYESVVLKASVNTVN
jgi:glycosyltransferase involved in cell wall biosynthesis